MPRPFKGKKEKQILKKIWDFHFWSAMARQEFMARYVAAMKIYMDQAITSREKQLIYERGQTDVSVNYLRFFLRKMQAYMTANQPQWHAFSNSNDDRKSAYMANATLGHIWRLSNGYLETSDIIKNGTVGGLGLFSSFIDYSSRDGVGDVKFRSLPLAYWYPDWSSLNSLFEDMSAQQIAYTIPLSAAVKIAPDRKNEIVKLATTPDNYDTLFQEGALTYGEFPDPYDLTRVRRISHYQIEEADVWELTDLIDNEKYRFEEKPALTLPYSVDIRKISTRRLVKYDCLYGMGEDDGIIFDVTYFPFSEFLVKPFIDEYTGNPFPAGEAYFLEKLQKYIDKSLRVQLQHEMWSSNPGVLLPKGSVDDKAAFEKSILWPGFVEEYNAEAGNPYFKQGSANQSGFSGVVQFMIETMKQATGNMFDPKMAKGNATEDQFMKQTGQEQGDMIFRNFESSLESFGKSTLKLAKYHYSVPMLLKFIDQRKRPAQLIANRGFVNEQGELDGYYLKDMDTDVALAAKSYAPTEKLVQMKLIKEAMQYSPPQVVDLLFTELIKAMELDPEIADEAAARLEILPQLMQQIQDLQKQLQQLQSEKKKMEGQLFTADKKAVRASYDAELQKIVDRFQTSMRGMQEIYKNNLINNEKLKKAIAQNNGKPKEKQDASK